MATVSPDCQYVADAPEKSAPSKCSFRRIMSNMKSMPWWEWVFLIGSMLFPVIVGSIIGATMSTDAFRNGELIRPDWAPPSWLFAPVWFYLYLTMGLACYLVWKFGGGLNRDTIPAIILYVIQLGFNFAWSPVFFGSGMTTLGVLVIGATWALVLACIIVFFNSSKIAALLLVPYLAWLSFASALNYSISCMNGCTFDPHSNGTIINP